jgi:acetyl-CoA C-acetyltransferase
MRSSADTRHAQLQMKTRLPVIIGIGEVTDKPTVATSAREPLELLIESARRAEQDVGRRCLRQVDTVRVVHQISWAYRDLASLLATRLRLRGAEAIYGPVGGESPVRMLVDAAIEIAGGESDIALVCGAEALKGAMALRMADEKSRWSEEDPRTKLPAAEDYVSRHAARYGLINPVDVYPIYEHASRAAWGQDFAEAQRESGMIWADMSSTAAQNPYAWSGKPMSAEAIVAPSEKNRPIAYPYQKFMVAQIAVNQSAAVLLTHRDHALALGVPESRLIHVGSGAGAHEPQDFLRRDRYDHSLAMEQVLRRTLELNGLASATARESESVPPAADVVGLVELYSCFPCVPKLARRRLGLAADRALSVAGGLTFFGGPGNNYMTHAITAMVRALRKGSEPHGLLYGNGEFLTKHHAAVLSTRAPTSPLRNEDLQAQVDSAYGPVPPLREHYEGRCTIETFSVGYSPKGAPDRGVVIGRTPEGARFLARVSDADSRTLSFLIDGQREPIGHAGYASDGQDGLIHFTLRPAAAAPQRALLFEKVTPHIAVVTLNRPDRRNAINGAVTRLMVDYLERIENDPDVRVAILTAAGEGAFCSGADMAEVAGGHAADLSAAGHGFAGFVDAPRRKPWIAAVRGFAVGGGTEIALACDLIVAGESATFGLPEVKRGLIAAAGGAYRLPRAISPRKAMELILTGNTVTAKEAAALHLLNRVTSDAAVLDEAMNLARAVAENAPGAVIESRKLAAAAFDSSDAALGERSRQAIGRLLLGDDAKEGVRAFLERRVPVWKGR